MASVRTVKNDIRELNAEMKTDNSAVIRSRKAAGYQIVPLESDAFERLKETVKVCRILYYDRSAENMNRRLFILQEVLSVSYVMIDDLAERLFVSRSSLSSDIAWVRKFLASYDLNTVSVPGKGMHVTGTEQNIRHAMIEVFSSQYHEIESVYPSENFTNFFSMDRYEQIRQALLKILRESPLSFSDAGTKKLATYLCLIRKRHASGYCIDPLIRNMDLAERYEYRIADAVFHDPLISEYVSDDEDETLNFVRMLVICRDTDLRSEEERQYIPEDIVQQSASLISRFHLAVLDTPYAFLSAHCTDPVSQDLQSAMIRILLQIRYDAPYRQQLYTYTETGENNYAPLAMEAARIFTEFLQEELNTQIIGPEIRSFASLFAAHIRQIPLSYQKRNLAVFSMEGKSVSEQMKLRIRELFPGCTDRIDVFDLYEMRRIDFSNYDAAVSSWNVAYYRYPIPLAVFTGISRKSDRKQLFDQVFRTGFDGKLLQKLKEIFSFHEDVPIKTYTELIGLVTSAFSRDADHQKKMMEKAVRRYSKLSYYNADSGISMIFLDHKDTGKALFEIYEPREKVFWGMALQIRYFAVICIGPELTASDARLFSHMIHMIYLDHAYVQRMKEDPEQVFEELYLEAAEDALL